MVRRDGTPIIVETHGRTIAYRGHQVRITAIRDITERKKAEEALRESEARFRTIAETLPVLISLSRTEDSAILFTNTAYNDAFGFRKEEIIGPKGQDVYCDPADRTKMIDTIKEQGFINNYQLKAKKSDGTPLWLLSSVRPIMYEGKPAIIGASIDITERKQAEEALRKSEKRHHSLFENMLDGYAYCRMIFEGGIPLDFVYLDVNPAFERLTGLKDVAGKRVSEVIPGIREANPELFEIYGRVAMTGKPERFETYLDSLHIWFSISVYSPEKEYFVAVFDNITERKRAEEALRDNIQLLNDIIDGSPSPIFLKDRDGKFITINASLERMLGRSRQELKGKTDYDIAPKEVADYWRSHDAKVMATGKAIQMEEVADLQDGHHIFLANKFPLVNANGQVYGIGAISHDITERKQAEEALRLSEEKFALSFANNPAAIAMTRLEDGLFLEVNDTWVALNGYSREEAIGHFAREMHIWPTTEAVSRFVQELQEKGFLRGWEQEFLKKSGEVFVAQLSAQVLTLRGEKVILSTFVDITERKRAEEALQTTLQRLHTLVASMHSSILLVNDDGRIAFANQAFCDYFNLRDSFADLVGITSDEMIEKIKNAYLHSDEQVAHIREIVRQGQSVTGEEIAMRNGRSCLRDFIPIYRDGKSYGRLWQHTDITERKRAEEELRKSRDELEIRVQERTSDLKEANEALRQLSSRLLSAQEEERKRIAGEIHDTLGACLSAIKFKVEGAVQQIGETAAVATQSFGTILPVIQEGIEECRRMQQDLRPSLLDDLGLLATLSWFCRRYQTIYTGIKVELEQALEESDIPNALKIVIFRVTQEGMNNIAKHSKADLVHLSLRKMDGRIELVLKDNGQGFDLKKVLGSESTKRGLGLTSMRERTELSGGSFAIESSGGKRNNRSCFMVIERG